MVKRHIYGIIKLILITIACHLSFLAAFGQQAARPLSGVVYDNNGQGIIGVVVMVKDTKTATVTDVNGNFAFEVPQDSKELVFSVLGYKTEVVEIGQQAKFEIHLKEDIINIDEVVVIGYGTAKKDDYTGSVATVKVNDLVKAPVGSLTEALAGRMAGVSISSTDGQPGQSANVVIRGASSMTQSIAPLYVVDGIPIEDFDPSSISSEDIESLSVLKDASAIAIYGARAANGVVVIKSKQGKSGKAIIDFSAKIGLAQQTKSIEMMNTYEYVKYLSEFDIDRANRLYFNNGMTLEDYRNVESIDWQKEVRKQNPLTQMYDLSVYGGTKGTQYRISGSYYDQDGIIQNSGSSSLRARGNFRQQLFKDLTLTADITYSHNKNHGQLVSSSGTNTTTLTNLLYRVWGYRPYSPNGNLEEEFIDDGLFDNNEFRINPVLSNSNEYRHKTRDDLRASLNLRYKLKDFTFLVTGAVNSRSEATETFNNSKTIEGSPYNTRNTKGQWGTVGNFDRIILTNENTVSYNKKIYRHSIDALAGLSFESGTAKSTSWTAINVPNEELGIAGISMGTPFSNSYSLGDYTMMSAFGRINYSFDSRYLFTATIRGDASSKFAPGHRWGLFPSGAFAWNIANEKFLKNVRWISNLKLRASYGLTGNNRIGNYDYIALMHTGISNYYSFGGQQPLYGVGLNKLSNPNLRWESTRQLDLGLEAAFFENRVKLEVDYYDKRTYDLLLNAQIPANSGYSYAMQNVGKIQNSGWEISLETINVSTTSFTWSSQFNISFNRNKVLQLNNDSQVRTDFPRFQTNYNSWPLYITEVGKPIGMFYALVWDGVYQYEDFIERSEGVYVLKTGVPDNGSGNVAPGDIKYKDINGDGTVNAHDSVVIGNPNPIHTGGFNNNFVYETKKAGVFSLNIFLQWSYGNDIFNANRLLFEGNGLGAAGLNQYATYADRWTPENPSNTMFRTKGAGPQGYISDRTLEDGSYLRLKTLEFSYGFPTRLMRRAKVLRSVTINAAVQNLFTLTGYTGLDPEVSTLNNVLTPGFDFCAYPRAVVYTLGCRVRF